MPLASQRSRCALATAALPLLFISVAIWCMHVFFIRDLNMTGDEVRYVAYGLGVSHGEGFYASDERWQDMLSEGKIRGVPEESPTQEKERVIHSVVYPLLGAVFIGAWQLDGARWFSFAVGLAGMLVLFVALRAKFTEKESLFSLAAVVFACPLLLYFRLFFSEIFLFLLNAILLWSIVSGKYKGQNNALALTFFICLFPFVHLKLSLECVVVFVFIFYQSCKSGSTTKHKLILLAVPAIMLAAFIVHNHLIFGAWIGGASPAFQSTLDAIPDRILVNLFDYRHGLISNAPHMLLACVGFVLVMLGSDREMKLIGLVFSAYFFTMLWANGSEAYAGRNWVAAAPFLAFWFARWFQNTRRLNFALAAPLFVLSGCLLCLMLQNPNLFLDNRSYSLPYDELFGIIKYFHFGYLLPYDFLDHSGSLVGSAVSLGLPVFALCSVYLLGQLLVSSERIRKTGMTLQIVALLTVLFFSYVEECKDPAKSITFSGNYYYANIKMQHKDTVAFIKIVNPRSLLKQYGFLAIGIGDENGLRISVQKASSVIPVNTFFCADTVSISEHVTGQGRVWMDTATDVKVYKRRIGLFECSAVDS